MCSEQRKSFMHLWRKSFMALQRSLRVTQFHIDEGAIRRQRSLSLKLTIVLLERLNKNSSCDFWFKKCTALLQSDYQKGFMIIKKKLSPDSCIYLS